ncbi:MAG: DUF255 domain-containing protein [Vicinamibacterales bacterium]
MWLEWSADVFARAEAERKPVLLSLVTAWSDECALMDRTTYSQPDVTSLIEARFVPVRVDADRRPDINDRYTLGGWPTTVFLTSDADALSGGTYFDAPGMIATLQEVADAYRDRANEIGARAVAVRAARQQRHQQPLQPSTDSIAHVRSLLIERFDPLNGGFGSAPKLPYANALSFAVSLAGDGDGELAEVSETTLQRMRALWDPDSGGFYRYADAADWTRPGSAKTLEDNAALLHVYVEAALRLRDVVWLEQAAAIVRWVRGAMADEANGGFFNARCSREADETMYVDRNAMMVGAFIRAAALFDDVWLRDFALKSLEAVIVPAYTPGGGVAHVIGANGARSVRGLLTDQIHVAAALIWAHAATGQLPYSMLAAEVIKFAIRTMWDEAAGAFRDRVDPNDPLVPFELNCHAACVLDRLGVLTGDDAYHARARTILQSLSADYREHDLFGAIYALAVREVLDRHPPAGLELKPVDWHLGQTTD